MSAAECPARWSQQPQGVATAAKAPVQSHCSTQWFRHCVAASTDVSVQVTGELSLAEDGWERLPRPLTAKERAIVEHDLRSEPRRLIAAQLGLTTGSVTVYRRLIRAKFRALPAEERPLWMRAWLRRFPGHPPSQQVPSPAI